MNRERSVPVAVNNRHVHLSAEDARLLFGEGHQFTFDSSPSAMLWPGHTLFREKVSLAGPEATISRVGVLGPLEKTSVEMSCADAYHLGLKPHDVKTKRFTPGVTIVGPKGSVFAATGYPVNGRWLVASKKRAQEEDLRDGMRVDVRVGVAPEWSTTFHEVVVVISDEAGKDRWAVYLDPDAASAASVETGETAHVLIRAVRTELTAAP